MHIFLCEATVPFDCHAKFHVSTWTAKGQQASLLFPSIFYDELIVIGYNYFIKYLMRESCIILSDNTTTNMDNAFCYFPSMLRVFFFRYVNEAWERRLGKDAPSFEGEIRPLGTSLTNGFSNTEGASLRKG